MDIGINFRGSSGYVTDGTNETYCLASDTYPTTRGGETFGWDSTTNLGHANRNSGVDRRLAGINYVFSGATRTFRLDLDATGEYEIHVALGDYPASQDGDWDFMDNTTSFLTITQSNSSQEWHDATDVKRTASTWPTDEASVTRDFSSTILNIDGADSGSASATISHLRVVTAAASPTTSDVPNRAWNLAPQAPTSLRSLISNVPAV